MKLAIRWSLFSLVGLVLAGLAVAGLLLGWFDGWLAASKATHPTPRAAPPAPEAIRVETVRPARRTAVEPALVEPLERVEVVPKITGYLQTLGKDLAGKEIDTGSFVKAGHVLAIISVPEMEKELQLKQATAREARASVQAARKKQAQAEKEFGKYQAEMAYWDEELGRYEKLYKSGGIEKSLLDSKRNLHKAAQAALEGAEERVAHLKADLLVAQARADMAKFDAERTAELLKYATVRLSSNGEAAAQVTSARGSATAEHDQARYVVTRRWADPGAYLQPGTGPQRASTILSLARVDRVKVVVDVQELDSARVELADQVIFQATALPGQKFLGKVSRFASALNPQARKMRVEIDLPNPNGRPLYPGMYGSATLFLSEQQGIVTIPSPCVRKEDDHAYVYCVSEGRAKKVPVTVGVDDGTQIEILRGLDVSSSVIRTASGTLKDGLPVSEPKAK